MQRHNCDHATVAIATREGTNLLNCINKKIPTTNRIFHSNAIINVHVVLQNVLVCESENVWNPKMNAWVKIKSHGL